MPGIILVPCKRCRGTGKDEEDEQELCIFCDGEGHIPVVSDADGKAVLCRSCWGKGKTDEGGDCQACYGTGYAGRVKL